jgi:hypothetical protein
LTPERAIQTEILRYLATLPGLRAWRSNTGAAMSPTGHLTRFGVKGQSDISGILAGGRFLQIEVKTPTGRLSPEQERWGAMITRFGGLFIVARCVEDVRRELSPFMGGKAGAA